MLDTGQQMYLLFGLFLGIVTGFLFVCLLVEHTPFIAILANFVRHCFPFLFGIYQIIGLSGHDNCTEAETYTSAPEATDTPTSQ